MKDSLKIMKRVDTVKWLIQMVGYTKGNLLKMRPQGKEDFHITNIL